jgi:hypothetical protein
MGRWWRYEGLGSPVAFSFVYAVAEYGYLRVYGGTEADYPNPPGKSFRIFW